MRILFVVNASASSVTARARVVIQKALAADHAVTVASTSRRGHATRLAQGAATEGADVVVVLGGDGTVNEAANGLVGTGTALAVLPGGSTNVFARSLGMTNDPIEATGELLPALAAGDFPTVGLGQANGRYFLFHVGAGYDAAVVAEVEKRAGVKRFLGSAVFVTAAVSTWARGVDRSQPWFTMHLGDGGGGAGGGGGSGGGGGNGGAVGSAGAAALDGLEGLFAICLNTGPYTYFNQRPIDLLPGLRLGDGLGVVAFRSIGLPTLLGVTLSAIRGGALAGGRRVVAGRGIAAIELVGHRPLPYQVDGDHVGEVDRLVVRYVPDAMRLVLPHARLPGAP